MQNIPNAHDTRKGTNMFNGPANVRPSVCKTKPGQYQYLGNCPSTPPLTQQQSIDNNLGLMLG